MYLLPLTGCGDRAEQGQSLHNSILEQCEFNCLNAGPMLYAATHYAALTTGLF